MLSSVLGAQAMFSVDLARWDRKALMLAAELRGGKMSAGTVWAPALQPGAALLAAAAQGHVRQTREAHRAAHCFL